MVVSEEDVEEDALIPSPKGEQRSPMLRSKVPMKCGAVVVFLFLASSVLFMLIAFKGQKSSRNLDDAYSAHSQMNGDNTVQNISCSTPSCLPSGSKCTQICSTCDHDVGKECEVGPDDPNFGASGEEDREQEKQETKDKLAKALRAKGYKVDWQTVGTMSVLQKFLAGVGVLIAIACCCGICGYGVAICFLSIKIANDPSVLDIEKKQAESDAQLLQHQIQRAAARAAQAAQEANGPDV